MSALSRLFLLIVLCFATTAGYAQKDKKDELRDRQKRLQQEIDVANKILKDTKKTETTTVAQLEALAQKIRIREELIRTIDREIKLADKEIAKLQESIDTLQKTTDKLKAEYAEMIRLSYKNRNANNELLFILSSEDFDQAAKRLAYLRQYTAHREQQVAEIKAKQEEIKTKIAALEQRKIDQAKLKGSKENEKGTLINEKGEQERVVADLKKRENDIQKDIKTKQKEANNLEKEIERIIAEEMRKARIRAEREGIERQAKDVGLVKGKDFTDRTDNKRLLTLIADKRKTLNIAEKPAEPEATKAPGYALTPEARILASNFAANKGKLPWPVERGIVVGKFGKQPHPVNKSIIVNNPHIEIATEKDATARAAFDGEVSSVIRIPGANKAVLISHGNYYTVYGNLVDVYVKSGDKVTTKQPLGKIYTDADNRSVLQFGLWLDDKIQDPEPWLVR